MDCGLPTLPPSVIEGVLDVTTVYYIQIESTVGEGNHPSPHCSSSCPSSVTQETPQPKSRPVATVRPFSSTRNCEQQGQVLTTDSEPLKKLGKRTIVHEYLDEEAEIFPNENTEIVASCEWNGESKACSTNTFDSLRELGEDDQVFPTPNDNQLEEEPSLPAPQSPAPTLQLSLSSPVETKLQSRQSSPYKKTCNPCSHHRKLPKVAGKPNISLPFSTARMEVCQNGEECHNNQGYSVDHNGSLKDIHYKETCITECLDEFLEELQLTHLRDYLKVLGCTCVRDLKLLEEPELNAIQLISRRRLLKRLESMSLHHEAPPDNCSLEGWLTWYGLTHIAGFLNGIGVLTVGDMSYLKEEDLALLKPITRRRILSLYPK